MVLDRQGGPNWFKNWCVAPVIVDVDADEIYFTPIYYTLSHFSKFIRPGAQRIGFEVTDKGLLGTAVQNPDNSIVVILFNETKEAKNLNLNIEGRTVNFKISEQALQSIIVPASQSN